jgi:hypothetical protein
MRREGGDPIKPKQMVKDRREPFHYKPFVDVVYWRKMLHVKIIFILVFLLLTSALGQILEVSSNEPPMLLLQPGSSVTGID